MPYDNTVKVITRSEATRLQAQFEQEWAAEMRDREEKGIKPSPMDYYLHGAIWARVYGAEVVQVVDDPPAEQNEVTHGES